MNVCSRKLKWVLLSVTMCLVVGFYDRLLKIKLGGAELNEAKPHQIFWGCLYYVTVNDQAGQVMK